MNDLFISFLKAFYFSLHAESNLIKLAFFFLLETKEDILKNIGNQTVDGPH